MLLGELVLADAGGTVGETGVEVRVAGEVAGFVGDDVGAGAVESGTCWEAETSATVTLKLPPFAGISCQAHAGIAVPGGMDSGHLRQASAPLH